MANTCLILLVLSFLVAFTAAAPGRLLRDDAADLHRDVDNYFTRHNRLLCTTKRCLFGHATLDWLTFTCICPDWSQDLLIHPCLTTTCDNTVNPVYSILDDACICDSNQNLGIDGVEIDDLPNPTSPSIHLQPRQQPETSWNKIDAPIPSYLPPPKEPTTPELLNQSLNVQPQNTATISSIIPDFNLGIFHIFLQLNGLVADLLAVNASVNLACASIGLTDPQPNLALVPKFVKDGQGAPQTLIADCEVIAVNMYTPEVVTCWVQKLSDGTIYSVLASNKVLDINKMDLGLSVALEWVVLQPTHKRAPSIWPSNTNYVLPQKRQIFAAHCGLPCPFYHMRMIQGTDGYCGCMFKGADEEFRLDRRTMTEPNVHTAIMTEEACSAMTCFRASHKAAIFNPFTRTCSCVSDPPIESIPSAWIG
ncbi:hypothetical protein PV10_09107 [Exophiala mesophila]|uniref:Extracellular membrane protein CFEM domain-containing protein n=1 Tax=Exophiala mesophila TaxID=212818 RepID=A0A0D1ZN23_EXOME|nr:uncharacterized protein PV10_09107 [Exophiala mesophila]KIV88188.1 hypothetical protein PV10_09107 [Exophiala mesophila]